MRHKKSCCHIDLFELLGITVCPPTVCNSLEDIPQKVLLDSYIQEQMVMGKMNMTPLSVLADEVFGKEGTPKRDAMEKQLKESSIGQQNLFCEHRNIIGI